MAYFSQNTIAIVKEMYEFWREKGSARISCTASFATSARSALSALRKQDSAWYGVRLTTMALPEREWDVDEKSGASICVALTMEEATGKTSGARAKALREAGMLVQGNFGGATALPEREEQAIAEKVRESKPTGNMWNVLAFWLSMGSTFEGAVENTVKLAMKNVPGWQYAAAKTKVLQMWEENKATAFEDPLTEGLVKYWETRFDKLLQDPTLI